MKTIMMSIRPKWVTKILNGEKTIEIRKRFPKDYVGWVYIYCTKEDNLMKLSNFHDNKFVSGKEYDITNFVYLNSGYDGKGKVVARFWCDKVEEIRLNIAIRYSTETMNEEELLKQSCLTVDEIDNYLWSNICCGKAIHITKLEIFDKPKEISEFKTKLHIKGGCKNCPQNTGLSMSYCKTCDFILPLTRAPQSWQFIEI